MSLEIFAYAQALGEDRRAHPTNDLTSALMAAEVDGEQLSPQEFGSFFILLVVAGNETTRNAISHGMKALTDYPDQRRIWFGDFDAHTRTAVEEIVRWATPVIYFRRTVTEDTELGGQPLRAGDKVVMFYESANRDQRGLRAPGRVRHHAPRAATAGRLRCRRAALLPRRQPRPPRDHRDVRRDPPPAARTCGSPASPTTSRATSSTASSGCPAPGRHAFVNDHERVRWARTLTTAGWLFVLAYLTFVTSTVRRVIAITQSSFEDGVWGQRIEILSFVGLQQNVIMLVPAAAAAIAATIVLRGVLDRTDIWLAQLTRVVAGLSYVIIILAALGMIGVFFQTPDSTGDLEALLGRAGGVLMAVAMIRLCLAAERSTG